MNQITEKAEAYAKIARLEEVNADLLAACAATQRALVKVALVGRDRLGVKMAFKPINDAIAKARGE